MGVPGRFGGARRAVGAVPVKRSIILLSVALALPTLAAPPAETEPALAALRGMGPAARVAWPQLAALVDRADDAARKGGDVARRIGRRHGWLGASAGTSRRETQGLCEALEAALLLERTGDEAAGRALHDWLLAELQAGLVARAARDDVRAPRLADGRGDARGYAELIAALPSSSARLYGPLDAADALLLALAAGPERGDALAAGLGARLARVGEGQSFAIAGRSPRGEYRAQGLVWLRPGGTVVELAPGGCAPFAALTEPDPGEHAFLVRASGASSAGLSDLGGARDAGARIVVAGSRPDSKGRIAVRWSIATSTRELEAGDETWTPEGAPGPALATLGASRLFQVVAAAVRPVARRGTVPAGLLVTGGNAVDPRAYLTGPEIFGACAEWIAAAEHEVLIQFFTWETGSDASRRLLAALSALNERPRERPVRVRIAVNQPSLGKETKLRALSRELAALGLDPARVDLRLEAHRHALVGALHTKSIVVDGRRALVTGANVEVCHDPGSPWFDAAFRLEGPAAAALRADFVDLWRKVAKEELPRLAARPPAANPGAPVLVATRRADGNPFKNDAKDPQGRAFLSAIRAARRLVRLHTPNLNDDAVKAAILHALVENGVRVELVLSRRFNERTESLPGQGGGNEKNADALGRALAGTEALGRLHVRWYAGPDGATILGNGDHAAHAKYASFDGELAIVGSGNLDTQSLNHSRELNLVVDGREVVAAWDARLFEPSFSRASPDR